ncbi:MAG: NUDIX hydrolase [Umezawaea sp.]
MNDDEDPARWAYLAKGNATQARKRVAAKVVIRDESGRVLLVDPNYKDYWDLPGGMVEANEAPRAAAVREVREELGATIDIGRLLVLDWEGPHGPWDDQLVMVFDGGVLTHQEVAALRVTDPELSQFAFLAHAEARGRLRADVGDRLDRALSALAANDTVYSEHSENSERR